MCRIISVKQNAKATLAGEGIFLLRSEHIKCLHTCHDIKWFKVYYIVGAPEKIMGLSHSTDDIIRSHKGSYLTKMESFKKAHTLHE